MMSSRYNSRPAWPFITDVIPVLPTGRPTVKTTTQNAVCHQACIHAYACWSLLVVIAQADVDRNVSRQAELLGIINKNTAAYRQAFGFREWRQACEVMMSLSAVACVISTSLL